MKHVSLFVLCLLGAGSCSAFAQQVPAVTPTSQQEQLVQLAKQQIAPTQLTRYNALLKEEIHASLRLAPGVLTLYAVAEREYARRITVL